MTERTEYGWERHQQGAAGAHRKGMKMARLISQREVASVPLLTLEISGDEAATYARCLQYMLENLKTDELERVTGAYRDEVEGILEDLLSVQDAANRGERASPILAAVD